MTAVIEVSAGWSAVTRLVLGLLCLAMAARSRRSRSKVGEEAEMPNWARA